MYHTEIKRRIRKQGLLHSIMLELTYKCNLDCFFCYNDTKLQGRQMRLAHYEKLFEQLIQNIRYMRELGLRPVFISTLTLWNENEIEAMYELADSLGVVLTFQGPVGPKDDGDTEPLQIQPSAGAWGELKKVQKARHSSGVQTFSVYEASEYDSPKDDNDMYCGLGTEQVMVDPFGSVYPCMHVRRAAGNLHDIDIKSIWGGSSVFEEALSLNKEAAARKKQDSNLSILGTPMFCPGMELRGCGSDNGASCGSGGCGSNINRSCRKGHYPISGWSNRSC